MRTETITLLRTKNEISLYKIETETGEISYRIKVKAYRDEIRSCYLVLEFKDDRIAQMEFIIQTGDSK